MITVEGFPRYDRNALYSKYCVAKPKSDRLMSIPRSFFIGWPQFCCCERCGRHIKQHNKQLQFRLQSAIWPRRAVYSILRSQAQKRPLDEHPEIFLPRMAPVFCCCESCGDKFPNYSRVLCALLFHELVDYVHGRRWLAALRCTRMCGF